MKNICLLILLAALLIFQSCSRQDSPDSKIADAPRKANRDFDLKADEFFQELRDNGAAVEQKYKNKTVSLVGWIASIEPTRITFEVRLNVTSNGGPVTYLDAPIAFNFDSEDRAILVNLKARTAVTISGVYSGTNRQGLPEFSHCLVIKQW